MRSVLLVAILLPLLACSRKADSKATGSAASATAATVTTASEAATATASTASTAVISSKDEVCNLLTRDEVFAEVKRPIMARQPPKNSPYGVPECTFLAGEGPDAEGYVLTLYFRPEIPDGPALFTAKVQDTCAHSPQQPLKDLGDEAVLCSKLLVRKGNVFFLLSRQGGDPAVPWGDAAQRLARKVLTRLP